VIALEELARRFALRPISSEQGLETYERIAVEDHVRDIISELCKIPAAREEFMLGDGIWFDNHTNALTESQVEFSLTIWVYQMAATFGVRRRLFRPSFGNT
jgi:hypothetical protein